MRRENHAVFGLSELDKVRVVCGNPECGVAVEIPVGQLAAFFGEGDAPTEFLPRLAALLQLSRKAAVAVEVVLPDRGEAEGGAGLRVREHWHHVLSYLLEPHAERAGQVYGSARALMRHLGFADLLARADALRQEHAPGAPGADVGR